MGKLGARAVDKRMRFVTAAEAGQETMTALCRRFGLSRKTGYKWLARYRLEGIDGLIERSRAPHAHPQLVTAAVAERCLAAGASELGSGQEPAPGLNRGGRLARARRARGGMAGGKHDWRAVRPRGVDHQAPAAPARAPVERPVRGV